MLKQLTAIASVLILVGCGASSNSSLPSASATAEPMISATPAISPSPIVTSQPSNSFDPTKPVVVGAASVTGDLGQEPVVAIDTTVAPAVELGVADILPGTGNAVVAGDVITAHYVGYGAASGMMFDASWLRGEPATFPLDGVIAGWQLGLVGMQEGGRRLLVIPADMGYGMTPPEGSGIAPGETLVFVVDLVAISK